MMLKHFLPLASLLATVSHSWVTPPMMMSLEIRHRVADPASLKGKTMHYRSFHRITEDSDVSNPKALTIEERQMAKLDDASNNEAVPYGRRLLILRNEEQQELLRFRVHESKRYPHEVKDLAPILYLSCEEPNLVFRNKVVELSSGLGLTGLLGTLAVGNIHRKPQEDEGGDQDDDFGILPTKKDKKQVSLAQSLLPPHMQSLTLSDYDEEGLQLVTEHLSHVVSHNAAANYFGTREFDWRLHPRFNPVKPFYGGIISNDVPIEYPSAKELARTVAHYLEPNGRFLHVCPEEARTNELQYIRKFLREGYLMSLDDRYFTVESHYLEPQILANGETPGEWKMESKTHLDCVALLAAHHPDYDGHNGEYLFPMENGKFDNKNSDHLERQRWKP